MTVAFNYLGKWLASYLEKPSRNYQPFGVLDIDTLHAFLQPADILLVEGNQRVSVAIKYLTQSTWSHAALYTGDVNAGYAHMLVEADLSNGVIAVPVSKYAAFNTRICRAVGLTREDREKIINFATDQLGHGYDLKNVIDLLRYLLPTPPVPVRWRRRMLALGSGDPTRAICSTLIAQAFQSVSYPILPEIERRREASSNGYGYTEREILHIRHHSLFTPRDFDLSPYFRIVKPTIAHDFNHRLLEWSDALREGRPSPPPSQEIAE
jgi:hypothetical protein